MQVIPDTAEKLLLGCELQPAINLIRSRALNHQQFQAFRLQIDTQSQDVIYHSDVHWFTHCTLLERFYSLRSKIDRYLTEKAHDF